MERKYNVISVRVRTSTIVRSVAKRKERKRTGLFLLFPDDENRQLMRQKVRFDAFCCCRRATPALGSRVDLRYVYSRSRVLAELRGAWN